MPVATCPSREELIDYAVGKLPDEAADAVAGHLDDCPSCQAELAALPEPDDSLIVRLRDATPSDAFLHEPGCSQAVAKARAVVESDESSTDLPRQLGEYQLLARLGSGGMGTVYKARHTKLGRVVALKVLTRGRAHDRAAVARFEREMQAIGQLDHRHIVRAHNAREIEGTPILVMEYLEGLDLGEIVRRLGDCPDFRRDHCAVPAAQQGGENGTVPFPCPGLPVPDTCELCRQAAAGLQTIYEHGLVHRDIKPSNLILAADGEVKILDLGLARLFAEGGADVPPASHIEETTGSGQAMGTADYMAPEQAADSRTVDIRADIYSLGCTLYKLLTGRAPFSGPEYCATLDKMNAHVHAFAPPVRSLAPDVPEGVAAVVDRMLAKNPADRFATPTEVVEALAPFCTGADLPALLKRAETSPPLPPGDGRGEGGSSLPSPSGRGAGGEDASRSRWKRFAARLVMLALVGGTCFALGIILRIHKDGKESTVEMPDGSNARVSADGQVDVDLPGRTKTSGDNIKKQPTTRSTDPWNMQNSVDRVEAFIRQNFPEITVQHWTRFTSGADANGNYAPRWTCDATIRGKGTKTLNLLITFNSKAEVVSIADSDGNSGGIIPGLPPPPLPTVRVTQPVVCNVSDYEEYTGRIEEGVVAIRFPSLGKCVFIEADLGTATTVREGDVLGEMVPYEGQELRSAVDALRNAEMNGRDEKSARAELERAKRNVPCVKVTAPISGKLGFPRRGGRGGGGRFGIPFNSITSPDSMIVTFDVPEGAVLAHRRMPSRKPGWELSLPVVCALADDKGFPYRGKVVSVAEGIDSNSHTQHWEAVVSNKDGIFMRGMSVRLRLITSEPHKVMLVSNRTHVFESSPGGEGLTDEDVQIVNDWNIVETRKVKIGRQYDRYFSIREGLSDNDWVALIESERGGMGGGIYTPGETVKPEKVTTPPPPWAAISVPPAVSVAHPVAREVTDYEEFTAHIEAAQTAEIRARATGNLDKVCFKPGAMVKKGDLLFEIDPRLYQAEVAQAAGAVKEAKIRLDARTVDFKRVQPLFKTAAVSQADFDQAKSQRAEAEAAVQTAEAALNVAKVRLDFTRIAAPFDGRIGRPLVDAGNLVTAEKTLLATLASTDPMYVYFDIDQRTALAIRRRAAKGQNAPLSWPVDCALPGEEGFPHHSTVESAEGRINPNTGTLSLRAVLPNKDGLLMPGMFVRVRLATSAPHKALLVPERSLGSDQGRKFLFVVNDQNVAEYREVETGPLQEDELRVVAKGVKADDWVVTSGLRQVRPAMAVTPDRVPPSAPPAK